LWPLTCHREGTGGLSSVAERLPLFDLAAKRNPAFCSSPPNAGMLAGFHVFCNGISGCSVSLLAFTRNYICGNVVAQFSKWDSIS
jgi:hypothetical protein